MGFQLCCVTWHPWQFGKKLKTRPQPSSQFFMCWHRNSHHSNQTSLWQQHALITTLFCCNHIKVFAFCDKSFFYHEFILSSICCMVVLVILSLYIISLKEYILVSVFNIYKSAKEIFSYHHRTLKGTSDNSSLICFFSRSIGADGINWFLLLTFDHFTARFLISDTVFLALTFDLVALSEFVFCCHNSHQHVACL